MVNGCGGERIVVAEIIPHEGVPRLASRSAVVELRRVTKRYGNVAALRDVSLAIHEGEFFSLLGPSGCGKTTTLNLIGGFVEPDGGDIVIQGQSVVGIPPYHRPVNTVFQSYALFPHMTVAANIDFGLRMRGVPPDERARRIDEMLELISLPDFGRRRPSQLSGGQQQRVALARALVNHPAVLLLDEPLGALDLKLRKQMRIELARIQRGVNITFVYVTHDQEEAMTMSDRIAVMNQGRVIQVGTPQMIYEHPASRFVAEFVGANVLDGTIETVESRAGRVRLDAGPSITAVCPDGLRPGDRVSVVIRPEQATIAGHPGPGTNAIPGQVLKASYLGTHTQVVVRVTDGTEMTALMAAGGASVGTPAIGEEIHVVWKSKGSLILVEEGSP